MSTKQLLSLSDEVVEKLRDEENKSALVDALLARHYEINLPNENFHHQQRHDILASLEDYEDEPSRHPSTSADWGPMANPLGDKGKPVDGVVAPGKELIGEPTNNYPDVKINLLGRPADQLPDGEIVNICETCGRDVSATGGVCLVCL